MERRIPLVLMQPLSKVVARCVSLGDLIAFARVTRVHRFACRCCRWVQIVRLLLMHIPCICGVRDLTLGQSLVHVTVVS